MNQIKSERGDDTHVIPVLEEVLDVQRRQVDTGGVRISKTVSEREEQVDEPVWREEIHVERITINRVVDGPAPGVRTEGEVMIVPVLEEVLVVQKQLRLTEELRITRRRVAERVSQNVKVRREAVTVELLAPVNQAEQGHPSPPNQEQPPARKEPNDG
jgi:uncharacterized protein (TIGR02271 family)